MNNNLIYYAEAKERFVADPSKYYVFKGEKIYHNPKIIILVRDLRSIFSSFEKHYLNNPEAIYSLSSHFQDNTLPLSIYKRVEAYSRIITFYTSFTKIIK